MGRMPGPATGALIWHRPSPRWRARWRQRVEMLLQRRLQTLLVDVIDSDQIVFLPLRIILDNFVLTHESIQWAMESRQESILLKFDLSKTYDRVDLAFMFQVMGKLGMPSIFIQMGRMLFHDATISVNINNRTT